MKKVIISIFLILTLMLAVCACDSSKTENESETKAPAASSESASESTTEPGGSSDSESQSTTETEATPTRATYKVTYMDYSTSDTGVPVVGAQVQLCNGDLCLPPVWTDESGVAEFKNVMIADYTITITYNGESFNAEFPEGSYEVHIGIDIEFD